VHKLLLRHGGIQLIRSTHQLALFENFQHLALLIKPMVRKTGETKQNGMPVVQKGDLLAWASLAASSK
jgi:hypothetical protein